MSAGLLDTSVVVDWHDPALLRALPDEMAISAITRNGVDFAGLEDLVQVTQI